MELLLTFYSDCFDNFQVYIGHSLKMCILFGHNSQIIFDTFLHKMNLDIFAARIKRYLMYAPPPTIL